jgi:alcohol dehydrogenase
VRSGQLTPAQFVTHRFALADIVDAYDVFGRASETGALKVALHR